ncbi:MAG: hypothetical protein Ct9H300mP4_12210 [Gammaproteobacteria bacterium]|nr:MAG: hypothetical protein Ct9H300mP4_12210 [Gammaproteobacteria bacterium]
MTSLTPPNAISELKSCAIDGVENEVPTEPLNNNPSMGLKLRDSLGSNEESFSLSHIVWQIEYRKPPRKFF